MAVATEVGLVVLLAAAAADMAGWAGHGRYVQTAATTAGQ